MQSSLKAASLLGIAALAALGLAGARPAAAQIVKDGSFETPASSPFETFGAGSTLSNPGETSPWTVGSGSVDVIDGYWMSYAGNQSIDLSGDSNGSIYQDLTTTIGTTYNVSYYLAGNPDDTQTIKTLGVSVGITKIQQATFDTNGHSKADMGWTPESITFKATGATTRLTFASLNDPGSAYGPALDNVQVTVAPEPSSITVFAFLGLGMLGLALKARKGRATA